MAPGQVVGEVARRARENEVARPLMTVPGMDPLIAGAIAVHPAGRRRVKSTSAFGSGRWVSDRRV